MYDWFLNLVEKYHEVYSIGHGECRHRGDTKARRIKNEVFANDGYMFNHQWQNYLYSTNTNR